MPDSTPQNDSKPQPSAAPAAPRWSDLPLEAAVKNSESVRKGEPPTHSTGEPAAQSAPSPSGIEQDKPAAQEAEEGSQSLHSKDAIATPWKGKKSEHWDAMKEAYEAKVAKLQREIQELKSGNDTDIDTVTSLKATIKELRDALRAVDAERDPEFRKQWEQREKSAHALVKGIAPKQADQLIRAASLPPGEERDKLVTELLKDEPPWKQAQVGSALNSVAGLAQERAALLSEAEARHAEHARRSEAAKQREAQKVQATFEEEVKEWAPIFEGLADGDREEHVEPALAIGRQAFNGNLSMKDLARFTMWGAVGPLLNKQVIALRAELEKLRKQVGSVMKALPDGTASVSPNVDPSTNKKLWEGKSWAEVAQDAVKEGLAIKTH